MDKFLKIQNFQQCSDAFKRWMKESHSVDVNNVPDMDLDKSLFSVMKDVKNEYAENSDISIKDLNNISLNKLQDIYVEKLKVNKNKTNASPLQRDTSLYGQRPLASSVVSLPTNTTNKDFEDVGKQLEIMMASRGSGATQVPENLQSPSKEEPIPGDAFEKMLLTARDEYSMLNANIELQKPLIPENNQVLYSTPFDPRTNDSIPAFSPLKVQAHSLVNTGTEQTVVIRPPTRTNEIQKYLVFNGFDRNWQTNPKRYSFSVDLADLSFKYKNFSFIKFTHLIIPNEIIESRTLINQPKFVYHHDHKLAYPYLLLKVNEFTDVCDGLNKQVQSSFAQFIYNDSYRCPNGRGYVILNPAQNETKLFGFDNLQRLTFSIQKPNGTLFNNTIDDYNVVKVDYQCYNTLYLQVTLDKFFDKNDFFIGDTVNISQYTIYKPPTCTNTDLSPSDFNKVMSFVNRQEGHEIVQLGDANQNGFYKSFYILAPGFLDQSIGKLTVEKAQVDALREYNVVTVPKVNGSIINISLQVSISLTVGLNVGDSSIIPSSGF